MCIWSVQEAKSDTRKTPCRLDTDQFLWQDDGSSDFASLVPTKTCSRQYGLPQGTIVTSTCPAVWVQLRGPVCGA